MKRVNCFLMLAAAFALTAGITSCNKNELENGNEAEGKKTYMTVSFAFPKAPQSYASTTDPNATEAEAAVNTVDVFIYTAAGNYSTHETIPMDRFTQGSGSGADKYTYKTAATKIATTTGPKLVFVGLNLPSDMAAELENKPVSELTAVARTLTLDELISTTTNFVMFSKMPDDPFIFVEEDAANAATANNITVNVLRMVAKVTVELSTALDVAAIPGELSDFTFAINNFNKKSFLVQGATPFKDPNWDKDSYTAGDFAQAVSTPSTPATDEYIPVVTTQANVKELDALYASENTSDEKRRKEITRVTVRARYIPANYTQVVADSDPVEFETLPSTVESPTTFWSVTPSKELGTSFFFDEDEANAYADEFGGDIVEYSGGYCYWNIYLNKPNTLGNRWDVLRNDYYRCTITRIAAIGNPSADVNDEDKDTPPDTDTNITTSINVLYWNSVPAYYTLEP